ncbi:MAG: TylF/MycF family methyltransferase [Spirochaetaceae bacterium]|jgi:O-methyltransferase|nr:TylF/MycF family methyltransferase [Spirochaetaceae bacterium]
MVNAVVRVVREIVIAWLMQIFTQNDIIRHRMLKLVAVEINDKKIKGCIAELGVYKGDFAKKINVHFPDKMLYLFDTFNGFDKRDIEIEKKFNSNAKENDFTNNNIALVLKKMKYPGNCIIKEGWFPETTKNVDEKFAFVSIDTDLFEPIYQGLLYFYARLEKGGYIFVHDYNGKLYGAKEAVQKFSNEFNVPYVPLSDLCGSVVFSK